MSDETDENVIEVDNKVPIYEGRKTWVMTYECGRHSRQ